MVGGEPRVPLGRSPARIGLILGAVIFVSFAAEFGRSLWPKLEIGCRSAVKSDLPSPDRAFDAATVGQSCLIGPRRTVVIVRKAGEPLNDHDESAQVFVAAGDPTFTVDWAGPKQIDIVLKGDVSLRSWRFVWADVTVNIDGRAAQLRP